MKLLVKLSGSSSSGLPLTAMLSYFPLVISLEPRCIVPSSRLTLKRVSPLIPRWASESRRAPFIQARPVQSLPWANLGRLNLLLCGYWLAGYLP
ncbi:hypothetical protein BO78DRAFT_124262 [Aspergillus sclerotiicarbonarius CBS 121057]|uniref:Uncharacterized protein n=1 Tax=Aspergillus sclerotiicarbonarius (strain CBS 121057 / IBT 28362) TaxID=1448318 RepID=A0A319FGP9_ASPSB|nr:hypothetical protein BO78DRAFT_124262 [Aspergillus sclerotiicarbonarius CBS 121057]